MESKTKSVNEGWETVNQHSPEMWIFPLKRFKRSLSRLSRRIIWDKVPLNEKSVAMEIGCGGSPLALAVAVKTKAQVIGTDLSRVSLDMSMKNAEAYHQHGYEFSYRTVQGNAFALPFADNSLDFVMSDGVVEHFGEDAARVTIFKEIHRCLKPGGYVLTLTPNNEHPWTKTWQERGFPWLDPESPIREYFVGPEQLSKDQEAAGLQVVHKDAEHPWSTLSKFPNWLPLRALSFVLNRLVPLPQSIRVKWGIECFVLAKKNDSSE